MYIIHHYNLLFLYNLYNNIDLFHMVHHNFCNEYFFFFPKVKLTFPQIINTIIKINLRSNILLFIFYPFPLINNIPYNKYYLTNDLICIQFISILSIYGYVYTFILGVFINYKLFKPITFRV